MKSLIVAILFFSGCDPLPVESQLEIDHKLHIHTQNKADNLMKNVVYTHDELGNCYACFDCDLYNFRRLTYIPCSK